MRLEREFMRELLWKNSRGLALAIQPLSEIQRQGVRALFTFFRVSRDTVDKAGSKNEALISVGILKRLFEASENDVDGDLAIDQAIDHIPDLGLALEAWRGLEEEFSIPRAYALEFVCGLTLEAESFTPITNEELLRFCYQTGGVLGLIASYVVGAPEQAIQSFVDAGSAGRLTSLANNVYKDFSNGRVFVPAEWIPRKFTSTFAKSWANEASKRFLTLANVLYASAREAFPSLPFQTRIAFSMALTLHRECRSSSLRKFDQVFDVLIGQTVAAIWSTVLSPRDNSERMSLPQANRDANLALRNQTYRFSRDLEKPIEEQPR